MNFRFNAFFVTIVLMATIGFVTADRLPNQTPENQIFTIDTVLDSTGQVDSGTNMAWVITSLGSIPTGTIAATCYDGLCYDYPKGQAVADVSYKDSILMNGGKLSENKNFDLNSQDRALQLYNIDSEKVLTYSTTEGAHMVGEEEYTLSVAGEAKKATDTIRCVFSTSPGVWLPPFCNIVSAKSALINVNSAQISTKGQIRAVAQNADIPAEVNYRISVTPDANSGSGFAEGTVKTTYAGGIMEGRGSGAYFNKDIYNESGILIMNEGAEVPWDTLWAGGHDGVIVEDVDFKPSAENNWKDSTEVTGGIKNFQKAFAYKSGFKF